MNPSYRIVVISPPGYAHSACFLEVAQLLVSALKSLDVPVDIKLNDLDPNRINILLGFHLLAHSDQLRDIRYIPYQLEQLSDKEGAYSDNVRNLLAGAHAVWDYSQENIAFLTAKGIPAKHVPVGYHPNLEQIPDDTPKEFDVLFYGSIGGRRKPVLDRLAGRSDLSLKTVFGAYGEQRDVFIARSRIILNIHYYEAKIYEAVRISYLLNNRCFVLTEESAINPYPGVDVPTAKYDDLERMCGYYVNNQEERDAMRLRAYEQFKEGFPMTEIIQRVIG